MSAPAPQLLIATTNAGKLREIRGMLAGLPIRILTLGDCDPVAAPEETGATFAENARQKAEYYAAATGLPTVAEDSGLAIDALGGMPGIESARFDGPDSTYPEKFALIHALLAQTPTLNSAARFVCALALVHRGVVRFEAQGTVEGRIASAPEGDGGFGYDPIFYYPPFGCTLAQAGPMKAEVSHRAAAFAQLKQFLAAGGTAVLG